MPKIPMDYSKTIIYKIVCDDLNVKDCYVGHTTDMTKRKWAHKSVCNNEKNKGHNLKIYKIIRENGGWANWSMLLVEKFPCKDKFEACKREREVYEELEAKMNTRRPYRTHEERKEELKQNYKKYIEEHKEDYKEYHKLYNEQYRQEHKDILNEKGRKYYQDHKEEQNQNYKKYYQIHKEEIKEKKREKIQCEFCSKLLSKDSMSRHHKTCKSKE